MGSPYVTLLLKQDARAPRAHGLNGLRCRAGYRFPMRVAGKSPPSWVPSELEWLWWLEESHDEFQHASSAFRGDVQR